MTLNEIIRNSGASGFLTATFKARQTFSRDGSLRGIEVNAIRPRLPHLDVHKDTTYRPDEMIDSYINDELVEPVETVETDGEYPSNDTLIPLWELTTRCGARIIQPCEETDSVIEVSPNGSVNQLPAEAHQLEIAMQLGTPLTIL